MATPTIPNGEEHFFCTLYEGNGGGQRVGKFVPFTDSGTIANSVIFNDGDDPELSRTPSSETNRDTWTLSFWIKRCNIGALQLIFQHGADVNNCTQFSFDSSDRLQYQQVDGGSNTDSLITNRTFEDTSKFYHILLAVDTTQATEANRVRMYVDGDEITSWNTANYPTQNTDTDMNTTTEFSIGRQLGATTAYSPDCYFAEMNFVDGTQLTPSTFGLTDSSTMRWIPKTLTGITYGTNGFRLKFQDSSALGDDTSGNGNDLAVNGIASTDQSTDSPTQNFNDMGGSQIGGCTLSEGNLKTTIPGTATGYAQIVGQPSFGVNSGKWYWEVTIVTKGATGYGWKHDSNQGGSQAHSTGTYQLGPAFMVGTSGGLSDGEWDVNYSTGASELSFATASEGDVLMFALDLDNRKGYVGKNGTWYNSADPVNGTGSVGLGRNMPPASSDKFYPMCLRSDATGVATYNFGATAFTHTQPTGFKKWMQDNLPETAKGITGMAWAKSRDATGQNVVRDSSRGLGTIFPSLTSGESQAPRGITKFLKGGYALGEDDLVGGANNVGQSFVSWNWVANGGTTASNSDGSITSTVQANTTAGFSIVQYSGNSGSAGTIKHGLSSKPEWIMVKDLDASSYQWMVQHTSLGATHYGELSTSNPFYDNDTIWNDTEPTSSVFSIGTNAGVNSGSNRYVAYCWHSVDGFSKFGVYEGNNNTDGTFVYTGFKPAWVMIKDIDNTRNWIMIDNARDPFNPTDKGLASSNSNAENTGNAIDFLSNGFKFRSSSTSFNTSSTYIYMAFAEHPFVGDGTNPTTAR